MPRTQQYSYFHAAGIWALISLMFMGGIIIPLVGLILFPIGLCGFLLTPFAKWLIFKTECPHCGHQTLQECWKTAYTCKRCKERVFVQSDERGKFTTPKP